MPAELWKAISSGINVIRRKGYQVDGIVLTEHRGFDFEIDYSDLAEQYGVVVMKGAEIETNLGHVLTYGITRAMTEEFDFKNITLPASEVLRSVRRENAYAIAAHPRPSPHWAVAAHPERGFGGRLQDH